MRPLTAPTIKNSNFTNPRWRTDAILKTVKSPYLCNRLIDFDEIWHDDAHCPLQRKGRLNFEFLKIQDGGSRHLPQRFDRSLRNLVR